MQAKEVWKTIQIEHESIGSGCEALERDGYDIKFIIDGHLFVRLVARRKEGSGTEKVQTPVDLSAKPLLPEASLPKKVSHKKKA